jgi:DNA-binding PadR family transcriptional regulator
MPTIPFGAPARKYPGTGPIVTKWLLDRGLIETVQNPQYRNDACYRLTPLGVRVLERGRYAVAPGGRAAALP